METIAIVKTSELNELLDAIKAVKEEIKQIREQEENLKAYTIQQAADLLNLHYNSVRKLVLSKRLFAKFLDVDKGKCTIPAWAIKEYLSKKEEKRNYNLRSTLKELKTKAK